MKKFSSLFLAVAMMAVLLTSASGFTLHKTQPPLETPGPTTAQGIQKVGTRANLISLLKSIGVFYAESGSDFNRNAIFTTAMNDAAAPMPSAAPAMEMGGMAATGKGDYSSTNSQVSGIDEGDLVKTDGRYIYYIQYNQIVIIEANGAAMKKAGVIAVPDDVNINQLYVDGDTLVTVGTRYESAENPEIMTDDAKQSDVVLEKMWWNPGRDFTVVSLYDVSDRAHPQEIRTVQTQGYLTDSRLYNGCLYFVSSQWIYSIPEDMTDDEYILPVFRDSRQGTLNQYVDPAVIDRPVHIQQASYTYIGALSLTGDDPFVPTVVLGAGNTLYMSQVSLYFALDDYSDNTPRTHIYRYAIDEGRPAFTASGQVDGTPLNQYAMDEYDGVFRIATTDWQNGNHVYTLDSALHVLGSLRNLAPGEQIYAVRFMGETGYVVTFKRVDPLFSIDLSDPNNPTLLGALKIPGFSSYLHPYGDHYLIGIGQSIADMYVRDEYGMEHVVGQTDMGIKFSLFDISDPKDVREVSAKTVGFQYSHSEALYNPRSILFDLQRNAFAIPASLSETPDADGNRDYFNGFVVMAVDTAGFSEKGRLTGADGYTSWNARMCYIGNTYYLLSDNTITAYDRATLIHTGSLRNLNAESGTGARPTPTPVPYVE